MSDTTRDGKSAGSGAVGARLWAILNSAVFIAILTSIVAGGLTQWYTFNQARTADLAARRAELSNMIVELDLRVARLKVVARQADVAKRFPEAQQLSIGRRAKAIVAGKSDTVVSDPAFHEFHLLTVLSRAEAAAGIGLTDKEYLAEYTDYDDKSALVRSTYVYSRLAPVLFYLSKHLATGDLPVGSEDFDRSNGQTSLYQDFNAAIEKRSATYLYPLSASAGG